MTATEVTVTAARPRGLRVAELAAEIGVAADTIRYYERAGLLPAPPRTASGYRSYDPGVVERLRFIQGAQRLGLRLKDIADLLAIRDTGSCPCEPAEQLLRRRLAEVDTELARLTALRGQMAAMLAALTGQLPDEDCPALPTGAWCPPAEGSSEGSSEASTGTGSDRTGERETGEEVISCPS